MSDQVSDSQEQNVGERISLQVLWPMNIGEEITLAHTSAVTTVDGGHILELGRFMLSGHVKRKPEEIAEFLRKQEVHVVGRFFLPDGSLQSLQAIIEARLSTEANVSAPVEVREDNHDGGVPTND